MDHAPTPGPLVIVGGGEDRPGVVLEEFARLAGGRDARIVVMTLATGDPDGAECEYCEAFRQIGVADVRGLDCRSREDAEDDRRVAAMEQATGVYFTGGDQKVIVRLLHETRLDAAMRRRAEGAVIGGTSAGASMMADTMMESGESAECPRGDVVELGRGMGLLMGVIIDQHFAQRGRLGRLLSALARDPARLGLGIGEDTAMVVEGRSSAPSAAGSSRCSMRPTCSTTAWSSATRTSP